MQQMAEATEPTEDSVSYVQENQKLTDKSESPLILLWDVKVEIMKV